MGRITLDYVISKYLDGGYVYTCESKALNIFGIRSRTQPTNKFNDVIGVFSFNNNDTPLFINWPATTTPGKYHLNKPMRTEGTAILPFGQYSFKLGKHQGKYEALVQAEKFKVWRDGNLDDVPDMVKLSDFEFQGINIHKAGADSTLVDKWSAGCQVFKRSEDFEHFMALVRENISINNTKCFIYTLFNNEEIKHESSKHGA